MRWKVPNLLPAFLWKCSHRPVIPITDICLWAISVSATSFWKKRNGAICLPSVGHPYAKHSDKSSCFLFVLFISDNLLIRIQIFSKSFFSSSHSYMSIFFFKYVPARSVNHVDLIPVGNAIKAACGRQWRRRFPLQSCQLLSCQTVGTGYGGTLAGCDTWLQRGHLLVFSQS